MVNRAKKKAYKHKHFGVFGTIRDRAWDKWDPSLGQTGRFLLISTVKWPFCPVCPWEGWGVCAWDDCPARTVRKMFMSEVSKRGWRGGGGVGDQQRPKYSKKCPQNCVLLLIRGHRKKGAEKGPESVVWEGFPCANPFSKPLIMCLCVDWLFFCPRISGWRKRGGEFKGGGLHDGFGGFDGFGGSGEHLALLVLVLQNTGQRGKRDGFGGYGGFGRDGYPP